jgi:hypothetical protein
MSSIVVFPEIFVLFIVFMYYRVHKNLVPVMEITVTKVGYEQERFFRLSSQKL